MKKIDYTKQIEKFEEKLSKLEKLSAIKNKFPKKNILININDEELIFNPLDSAFTTEKELNSDIDDFLFKRVDKFDFIPNLTVKIKINNPTGNYSKEEIESAFRNHFKFRAEEKFLNNRKAIRKWTANLIIGVAFLGLCLGLAQILHLPFFKERVLHDIEIDIISVLRESLSIIGWVAIWEPSGYLLFSRKEDQKILRNYMLLHKANYIIEM